MNLEDALKKSLVVIPSINGGRLLRRMLPTLDIPPELVVVLDQGSSDDSEAVASQAGVCFVQLGRPHTYTQACNVGLELARKRGCAFLFVANNDITFRTDVVRELLAELIADPELGIVAPSQTLIDEKTGLRLHASRVFWNLETMTFGHDFNVPGTGVRRLESDFCELTFAGIRMSTIDAIGFLDDAYGFYHEDADFCYRLRQAGYACAYLPGSRIEHWTSSTFSGERNEAKLAYLARNKQRFQEKFLGYYVKHADHKSGETNSWNIINRNLHPALRRFGLLSDDHPELIFSHPGIEPFDYLYTVWETSRLPESWLAHKSAYKLAMAPSRWNHDVLKEAGFGNVHYVPLGVESDVFHPWGSERRLTERKTFLWFSSNQHRKGLDIMLRAWASFNAQRPGAALLILMGTGILSALPRRPDTSRRWGNLQLATYEAEGLEVHETIEGTDERDLAAIYRGVDFTVCSSRAEGFGFVVAESLACGTPAIFGNYGGTADFASEGALLLDGRVTRADYSDKGFDDVGDWWEPEVEQLTARLIEAFDMDDTSYRALSERGTRLIRSRFSWRATSLAIRAALVADTQRSAVIDRSAESVATPSPQMPLPPSRLRNVLVRNIRRVGDFSTHVANRMETHGAAAAFGESGKLLGGFVRSRMVEVGRRLRGAARRRLAPPAITFRGRRKGTLFVGYAEGALGLGQAFRSDLAAAAAAELPFAVFPFQVGIETRLIGPYMPERYDREHAYDINVIEVAPDQAPVVFGSLDKRMTSGSYNILRTYWELPKAPEAWRPMLQNVSEIWAPNAFVGESFRDIFDGPITVIPPAVVIEEGEIPDRAHYGMEPDRFYFLFSFDYFSSAHRKNPLGVLQAFRRAFPSGSEKVGLIIKSTGAVDHYPEIKNAIQAAQAEDPRIRSIDTNLSRGELLGLIRAADAYVSLHRAEGFGLGMAEAMSFGRIVIGTDYSGSTDFLSSETGFAVPYTLRPVLPHEYVWADAQVWAEPDLDAAIAILREVAAAPERARQRAEAGRLLVKEKYGLLAVGQAMQARLAKLA